ncbi:MAG TPA: exopolysaccharide biosynthesis protein [Rhodanobacteraceae bacterium]
MTPSPDAHRRTTTALLREALNAQPGDDITLDTLLVPLRTRAFGVLLLVLAIPNFIPVPIGIGGVMGVLVIVLGFQMLIGLDHPLVPARLRRKTMRRARVEAFLDRSAKVMHWLERWCKPRLTGITMRPWSSLSGLALMILGLLLSLPIPFTNYPFGVILLAFAFALIERDGMLLVGFWVLSIVLLVLSLMFSHALVHEMQHMLQLF